MSGNNSVLLTNANFNQAQETSSPRGIGNDGKHTVQGSGNATNLDIVKVTKAPNFSNQTGNQNVRKTTVNDKPVFVSSRSNVDKALDTLWTIESYLDEATQKELNFRTDSVFWGTVKNLFCKFLGFFCSAVKENRTKALDLQINNVLQKIYEDEAFYNEVFQSVMNDKDIDEELKTTFSNLFEDRKKLSLYLESPDEDIIDIFKNYKDVIKNGKLFGKDVYDRWLSPLMNDKNTTEKTKLDLCTLFNDNPEIQDKLFKSLKNPPNEIREQFWERNKEKILNGEFFGFQLKDTNAEAIKNEFMSVEKEPLQSLLIKNISAEKCKNLNEYRGIFEKSNLPKTFTQNGHVETFLMSYFSVTEEHAKTLLQEDLEAGKVGDLNEQHRQNADKIFGILSKSNSITFGDNGILLFRELFQGGDGKRFTFTVNGQTVCDIDQSKLKELAKQKEPAERRHLAEILKLANNDLKQAQEKYNNAPEGSEEENVAWGAVEKAEKKLQQAEVNFKNYKPTVTLKDFFDEIKTQINGKNIDEASVRKLALFLASGISVMPPTDQAGRGICNMNRCHCSCTVSEDDTLTINQKFDKVKSNQEKELASRFRKATADFQSVGKKCYTETTMEIERTYDLFTSGSRSPKTAELKSLDHSVKFED